LLNFCYNAVSINRTIGGKMIGYKDEFFTYTKVSPRESAILRKESRRAQKEMIILYACYGLLDDIFLPKEVSAAKTYGLLPKGWSCHHIIPLSGGGTNSTDNLCIIARDFHDAIETIYSVQTARLKIGESVELPVLGLRSCPRIFANETAEYQAYVRSIDCLASGNPAEKLELLELNRAAKRRLAEQASHHNPDKVALSSQCKMNFNQAKAPLNIIKAVSVSAFYTKDYRSH